jgi:hypothetical protein
LWKKDEKSAKTQEEIENNTFTWEKNKRTCWWVLRKRVKFPKNKYMLKRKKTKNIYIYITNKIYFRTK